MPNQGNKSNGSSGVVKKKKQSATPSTTKQGTASATKYSGVTTAKAHREARVKEEARPFPVALRASNGEKGVHMQSLQCYKIQLCGTF